MAERIDARLVAAAARGLAADRHLPFSDRQLWYAVCARLEHPDLRSGAAPIVAGVLLVAVGVGLGVFTLIMALLVPVGMILVGLGVQRRRLERSRPSTRALAVSYDAFVRETLAPLRAGTASLEGLVEDIDAAGAEGVTAAPAPGRPVVVCDRGETALLLEALRGPAGLDVDVVSEEAAPRSGRRRLLALHDADPRGCALPLRLAAAGAAEVVDLGLRPGQLRDHRVQVIEGAPALVPVELSGLLSADEVVWLAEGRRVELATLTPAQLADGLRAAVGAAPVAPPGRTPRAVALGGVPLLPPPPPQPTPA